MSDSQSKREIPSSLKKLLDLDVKLSKEFVELVNKKYPIETYRAHLKSLEVSFYMYNLICYTFCNPDIVSRYTMACAHYCWALPYQQLHLYQPLTRPNHRHCHCRCHQGLHQA